MANTAQQIDFLIDGIHENGSPLEGGKVFFFAAGTTNSQNIYDDADTGVGASYGCTWATKTPTMTLDSDGRPDQDYYAEGNYQIYVLRSDDTTYFTTDDVFYALDSSSATFDTVTQATVTPTNLTNINENVICNPSGAITVNLPTTPNDGCWKKITNKTAHTISIVTTEKIHNTTDTSLDLTNVEQSVILVYDATNVMWHVMGMGTSTEHFFTGKHDVITPTSVNIGSSTTVTGVLDEDDLVSDSAVDLATQQSIKAYIDALAGVRLQYVSSISGAMQYFLNATQLPFDDTIPQNNEGEEVYTVAITPTSAINKLVIEFVLHTSVTTATGIFLTAALFQDSTASALAATWDYESSVDKVTMRLRYEMAAGTISETTFKVRIGDNTAGTSDITINGHDNARLLGGVLLSGIWIEEIQV